MRGQFLGGFLEPAKRRGCCIRIELLTGSDPAGTPEAIVEQIELLPVGAGIVTLGTDGALVRAAGATTHVSAPVVTAVDATAAGDAFCAGLADALAGGATPLEAARWGVRVGAVTVTRAGAQASLPSRSEVEALT